MEEGQLSQLSLKRTRLSMYCDVDTTSSGGLVELGMSIKPVSHSTCARNVKWLKMYMLKCGEERR